MLNRWDQCPEVMITVKTWKWCQESSEISGCTPFVGRESATCDQPRHLHIEITQLGSVSVLQQGIVPSQHLRGRAANCRTQMSTQRSYYCTNSIWHLLTGCISRCHCTNASTSQVAHPVWYQLATFLVCSQLPMILQCNLLTFEQELTYSFKAKGDLSFFFIQ